MSSVAIKCEKWISHVHICTYKKKLSKSTILSVFMNVPKLVMSLEHIESYKTALLAEAISFALQRYQISSWKWLANV